MAKKDKYTIKRSIRFTEKDYATITEQAERYGIPAADYMRKRILGKRVVEKSIKVNDMKLIAELQRQGGLLKKFLVDTKGTIDEENREIAKNILISLRFSAIKIAQYYERRLNNDQQSSQD